MLNLEELEQLVAFADSKTLSRASEVLHISQPTLTRTMQHIEAAFGVSLFDRGKNRIALNSTGEKAVELARKLLSDAQSAVQAVQSFDQRLHTVSVEACAPAPTWTLIAQLASKYPENTVSSRLLPIEDIIRDTAIGSCDIGILPCRCRDTALCDVSYLTEKLSVCVPVGHCLSDCSELTFEQLNGFNCLLLDEIGFWTELCRQKMPASRFLIQTNQFEFEELIKASTLLCFTTNCFRGDPALYRNRIIIPVADPEANVTYHLISAKSSFLTLL